jgi:hypothetical protein
LVMNEQQLGNVLCLVCHPAGSHQNSHCHRIKTPIVILSEAKDLCICILRARRTRSSE